MQILVLELTHREMEALQSLFCTADLSRITEDSMQGFSTLAAKVYQFEKNGPTYEVKSQ